MSNRGSYSGFSFKQNNSKLSNSSKKFSMNAVPPPSSLNTVGRPNQQVSKLIFDLKSEWTHAKPNKIIFYKNWPMRSKLLL